MKHLSPKARVLGAALTALPGVSVVAAPRTPASTPAPSLPADAYRTETAAWRAQRDARLRADDGWLTLVGLVWLRPGANRFGSAPDNEIHLPGAVPPHAGTLVLEGHAVRLVVPPGSPLRLNGGAARTGPLRTDATPTPDVLGSGTVSWQVIERGERLGVRVRDSASPLRRSFAGSSWFPIDPAYRVVARLVPRVGTTEIVVPDATGGRQKLTSPGTLELTLLGKPLRLDPVLDGDDDADQLIVFRDLTSGRQTYGGGRFVRARRQPDGTFVVDFNRAYAPPCALTPYATCPLPPDQNRWHVAVEAGERYGAQKSDTKSQATSETNGEGAAPAPTQKPPR
jgi:uncharacterized protein (DUF1684 family)